ncbi:aspartate kinase [Marivirga sp. S37H4]|uniref:Aspartokinase n=1 Tax=Marivirga aurantiaca TaxID=2802615 RepID=A0A934X0D4_9BACT|nr:aspartate kinase [Marivirga aurantiaca]MBK6266564.1 aspartate kinase [Marivirga aurantiaca]
MQVFKFGGASIKDASAVRNMAHILKRFPKEKLVVVVSAMGKSTNALEAILHAHLDKKSTAVLLNDFYQYHHTIIQDLFIESVVIVDKLKNQLAILHENLSGTNNQNYDASYDRVISNGEFISSIIIEAFLQQENFLAKKYDANEWIKTDSTFRDASIDWATSERKIFSEVNKAFKEKDIVITQGFIGSNKNSDITTLGREGSDFTAAIFAYCLNTKSVTIWKDVPGILNADPKKIADAKLYEELSYKEAAEMTYYGASVIHPKTIKPLANKNIPLYVRSFQDPDRSGTIIYDCQIQNHIPCIIIKEKQCLITFQVTDFTFINENNLSRIFTSLDQFNIKINMMQNSAISFSICVNDDWYKLEKLLKHLENDFDILYNKELELITIKNYEESLISDIKHERKIYLEQKTRKNFQMVVKPK